MSTNIVELKSYISVYDSVDRESGKTETEVHCIHFFESLPEGMKESPIQLSLCRYVKKYAMTAYDPDDIDNVCHCSQEEREAGFCNCFDFLEELPYRLKYLHEDYSISFRFSYDYGNFSPESVTVIQSSLSADDTEFLCGVIRAAYDVYYAQKNGLEGYPKYARCYEGSFYEGMQAVYSFVPGFEVFRKILTLPDAVEQKKEASGQSDAKLKVKRKHKHGTGKVEEAYQIFAKIRPNKGAKRKEPEPQAIVSRREFKNWLGGNHVPKGFPGIKNISEFSYWADNWDSEGKRRRTVNGMSEEEKYRKREK